MSSTALRISLYSMGGTLFVGTAYIVGLTFAPAPKNVVTNDARREQFEHIAPTYESKTQMQEWYLGIGRVRRRMLREYAAHGRVLEVGAGTASNFGIYPATCDEVVLCDRAVAMVDVMSKKIAARRGNVPPTRYDATTGEIDAGSQAATDAALATLSDAAKEQALDLPPYRLAACPSERLPFKDESFDVVVDMFGLCSFDDPVAALREMSRVCRPDGKLILVEHGRGWSSKLNNYLDKWAPRHAANWGCWWNRDIRRYVRLADLHTELVEEKHFGTTHIIVAKPPPRRRSFSPPPAPPPSSATVAAESRKSTA